MTSKFFQKMVRDHVKRRLAVLINPFFTNPSNFLNALTKTHSIISGSQALRFMMPPFQDCWKPDDMDIYTNLRNVAALISYMESQGYSRSGTDGERIRGIEDLRMHEVYAKQGGVSHVIKMSKIDKKIDIIVSSRVSPIYPLFFFHTTLVQNFISGQGFFSTYPNITDKGKALLNPMSFWPRKMPTAKIKTCIEKYVGRGFEIGLDLADIDDGRVHKCQQSAQCPHSKWSTTDGGCLYMPFDNVSFKSKMVHRIYCSKYGGTWHLGGKSCDGTYNMMRPSVYCTGRYVNP